MIQGKIPILHHTALYRLDEQKRIVYETISIYHLKQFLSNMGKK